MLTAVADSDLQVSWGPAHPKPRIRGGAGIKNNFFSHMNGLQFDLKMRREHGGPSPSSAELCRTSYVNTVICPVIESYWAVLSCGTFIVPYRVVQIFESAGEILKCDHSKKASWQAFLWCFNCTVQCVVLIFGSLDEMKVTEQYFPVVQFIMLYKVVSIFESVDKIL